MSPGTFSQYLAVVMRGAIILTGFPGISKYGMQFHNMKTVLRRDKNFDCLSSILILHLTPAFKAAQGVRLIISF
jgi:hypothetical protein